MWKVEIKKSKVTVYQGVYRKALLVFDCFLMQYSSCKLAAITDSSSLLVQFLSYTQIHSLPHSTGLWWHFHRADHTHCVDQEKQIALRRSAFCDCLCSGNYSSLSCNFSIILNTELFSCRSAIVLACQASAAAELQLLRPDKIYHIRFRCVCRGVISKGVFTELCALCKEIIGKYQFVKK